MGNRFLIEHQKCIRLWLAKFWCNYDWHCIYKFDCNDNLPEMKMSISNYRIYMFLDLVLIFASFAIYDIHQWVSVRFDVVKVVGVFSLVNDSICCFFIGQNHPNPTTWYTFCVFNLSICIICSRYFGRYLLFRQW